MSTLSQAEIDALFKLYGSGAGPDQTPGTEPSPAPPGWAEPTQGQAGQTESPVEESLPPQAQPRPEPQAASFPSLQRSAVEPSGAQSIGMLAEVELELSVRLGRTRRRISEILSMTTGSVLELDNQAGEAVDILVNGLLVARGEVVVVGEHYGLRITELLRPTREA